MTALTDLLARLEKAEGRRPLTPRQVALVGRLIGGRLLMVHDTPGREHEPGRWYIEHPYSDEDGRTAWSLIERGLLNNEGAGMWTLKPDVDVLLKALIAQEGAR